MKLLKFLIIFSALAFVGCANLAGNSEIVAPNASKVDYAETVNASDTSSADFGKAVSTYTTNYPEKKNGRVHNIKLAASKLNGAVVKPGEVFSYNDRVGSTGKEDGYQKARIFVRGKDAEGYGGGVCQVSSTLYNAVLEAKLEVVERHPHSKKVGYVPEGRDAATSAGGNTDFKFKNTTQSDLLVSAITAEGNLTVKIDSK